MTQANTDRLNVVLRAAERWRRSLVDVSGRNRLRLFRDLKTGTLDLTPHHESGADARALDRLLGGRAVSLSSLFPSMPADPEGSAGFDDARRRLRSIHKTALRNLGKL